MTTSDEHHDGDRPQAAGRPTPPRRLYRSQRRPGAGRRGARARRPPGRRRAVRPARVHRARGRRAARASSTYGAVLGVRAAEPLRGATGRAAASATSRMLLALGLAGARRRAAAAVRARHRLQPGLAVPLVVVGVGVAILWRQADDDARERWRAGDGDVTGCPARVRAAGVGIALVVIGGAAILVGPARPGRDLRRAGGAARRRRVGLALVSGAVVDADGPRPRAERSARIREQERAEVAAHVHDSVLHTLTLIQRHVDDPREVARLARAQERELRGWLYRPRQRPRRDVTERALERGGRRGRGRARRRDRGRRRRRLPASTSGCGALLRRGARGAGQRREVRRATRRSRSTPRWSPSR